MRARRSRTRGTSREKSRCARAAIPDLSYVRTAWHARAGETATTRRHGDGGLAKSSTPARRRVFSACWMRCVSRKCRHRETQRYRCSWRLSNRVSARSARSTVDPSARTRSGGASQNLDEQQPGKLSKHALRTLERGRAMSQEDYLRRLLQRDDAMRRLAALAPVADALISVSSPGPAPIHDPDAFRRLATPPSILSIVFAARAGSHITAWPSDRRHAVRRADGTAERRAPCDRHRTVDRRERETGECRLTRRM